MHKKRLVSFYGAVLGTVIIALLFLIPHFGANQQTNSNTIETERSPQQQAEASDVPAWKEAGLSHDPNEGEPAAPTAEEVAREQADNAQIQVEEGLDAKEASALDVAKHDTKIRAETKGAANVVEYDYVPAEHRDAQAKAEGRDLVVLQVAGKRWISGDYRQGVTFASSDNFKLTAEVKGGQVISYEKTPLPDTNRVYKYNDAELAIMDKLLQDETIANLVQNKTNWYPALYGHPRGAEYSFNTSIGCMPDTCVTVMFKQFEGGDAVLFKYDTASGKIMNLVVPEGWKQ